MLDIPLVSPILKKRIDIFSKTASVVARICGSAIALSQIVKILPFLEASPSWDFNWSNLSTLTLGIFLLVIGTVKKIKNLVYYSFFSGRERMKRVIFSLPISATLVVIVILKAILGYDNPSYEKIMGEGGLVEYGTILFYVFAFALALPIANRFIAQKQKLLGIFYYLLALFCIFVALEEGSWGQRLIGIEVPRFFEDYNVQEEITLHNLVWIHYYLRHITIAIGAIGGFSWSILRWNCLDRKLKRALRFLLPDWFVASFFWMVLIISILLLFQDTLVFFIAKDQEFGELILEDV